MTLNLDFVLQATGGKVLSQVTEQFSGYSTDNRDPQVGNSLFIPLVGDAHDAHKFVTAAVEAGAAGVLVHQWNSDWEPLKAKATFIEVSDTLLALQNMARHWRKKFKGKVLGLTGSNGKTTSKDFLRQILAELGSVNASRGSFNNHWGVPFTLLDSDPENDFCVVEMGMNHAGEIAKLVSIADPDLVTVTNVGRAHIGNFSNGVEGIAAAKEEIYEGAKAQASLLFNLDNKWTFEMYKKYVDRATYTYSNHNFSADVYFKLKEKTETGMIIEGQIGGILGKTEVGFWGEHNIQNLTAAVCLAYIGGCKPEKIWNSLKNCHTGWGRNQWLDTESGSRILFDGYNANPDSFQQLLNNVKSLLEGDKPCVAIFGEMLELGDESAEEHYKLGLAAGQLPWAHCWFIGPSGPDFQRGWQAAKNEINPIILSTYKETLDLELPSMVDQHTQYIVKGSRGGALERFVERLSPVGFAPK